MAATEGIGGYLSASATLPTSFDDNATTGYPSLSWTDINQGGDIPEFGPEHSSVTFTPLKTGIVNKFHGELNYGSFSLPGALDSADTGQTVLKAALTSKDEIAFRETRSDGSIRYFAGKVMSFRTGASVGSVVPFTCNIEVTRATVEVAA